MESNLELVFSRYFVLQVAGIHNQDEMVSLLYFITGSHQLEADRQRFVGCYRMPSEGAVGNEATTTFLIAFIQLGYELYLRSAGFYFQVQFGYTQYEGWLREGFRLVNHGKPRINFREIQL